VNAKMPYSPFLHSKMALRLRGIAALLLAYWAGSAAIDSGRWLHYFLTLVCLALAVRFFISSFKYEKQ
jgi:hypothetical protein